MKKQFLKLSIVCVLMVASIVVYKSQQMKRSIDPLILANVEALASGELGGTIYTDKKIYDEIISTEVLSYGIKTTYRRDCAWGGNDYCQRGTWVNFTPRNM